MSNLLEVGSVIAGTVINVKPYGVFVSVGDNQKGLVHISQVSDNYIKDINQLIKSGDEVNVKVLDNKDGKISLSIKEVPDNDIFLAREEKEEYFDTNNIQVTHKCFANKEKTQENKSKSFDELMKDFNRQSNDRIVDINRRLKNR